MELLVGILLLLFILDHLFDVHESLIVHQFLLLFDGHVVAKHSEYALQKRKPLLHAEHKCKEHLEWNWTDEENGKSVLLESNREQQEYYKLDKENHQVVVVGYLGAEVTFWVVVFGVDHS